MEDNQSSSQEKTEQPTDIRRQEFRKRGQVAQTNELSIALLLIGILILSWFVGRFFLEQIYDIFYHVFDSSSVGLDKTKISQSIIFVCYKSMLILGPIFLLFFFTFYFLFSYSSGLDSEGRFN